MQYALHDFSLAWVYVKTHLYPITQSISSSFLAIEMNARFLTVDKVFLTHTI